MGIHISMHALSGKLQNIVKLLREILFSRHLLYTAVFYLKGIMFILSMSNSWNQKQNKIVGKLLMGDMEIVMPFFLFLIGIW